MGSIRAFVSLCLCYTFLTFNHPICPLSVWGFFMKFSDLHTIGFAHPYSRFVFDFVCYFLRRYAPLDVFLLVHKLPLPVYTATHPVLLESLAPDFVPRMDDLMCILPDDAHVYLERGLSLVTKSYLYTTLFLANLHRYPFCITYRYHKLSLCEIQNHDLAPIETFRFNTPTKFTRGAYLLPDGIYETVSQFYDFKPHFPNTPLNPIPLLCVSRDHPTFILFFTLANAHTPQSLRETLVDV